MPQKVLEKYPLPVAWIGLDDAEIRFANQILFQMGDPETLGEFILTFGQLHPPVLLGTPEENAARLKATPYVPIKVVAKLALNEAKVRDLVGILQKILASYDGVKQAFEQGHDQGRRPLATRKALPARTRRRK